VKYSESRGSDIDGILRGESCWRGEGFGEVRVLER